MDRWEMMQAHKALVRAMSISREELAGLLGEGFAGQINGRQYDMTGFLDAVDRIRGQFPDYGMLVSRKLYGLSASQSGVLVAHYHITLKGMDVPCEDELQLGGDGKVRRYRHHDPTVAPVVLG